jgi:hypothetical protein
VARPSAVIIVAVVVAVAVPVAEPFPCWHRYGPLRGFRLFARLVVLAVLVVGRAAVAVRGAAL